jgi:hypothetical protein
MTVYIVKIKIHENITEEFSYVEPKSYDMSGKFFAFQEKLRYVLHCNLLLGHLGTYTRFLKKYIVL